MTILMIFYINFSISNTAIGNRLNNVDKGKDGSINSEFPAHRYRLK